MAAGSGIGGPGGGPAAVIGATLAACDVDTCMERCVMRGWTGQENLASL